MSMINYASREINCKIVYYGPGLGGKTTNLEHVYGRAETKSGLESIAGKLEHFLSDAVDKLTKPMSAQEKAEIVKKHEDIEKKVDVIKEKRKARANKWSW